MATKLQTVRSTGPTKHSGAILAERLVVTHCCNGCKVFLEETLLKYGSVRLV